MHISIYISCFSASLRRSLVITNGITGGRGRVGKGLSRVNGLLSRSQRDGQSKVYRATQGYGGVIINTRSCCLQSALEFLVILTSAKHTWQSCSTSSPEAQRETLQEALEVACREQGKSVSDMKLKFHFEYNNNFWFGRARKVCSPVVHAVNHIFEIAKVFEVYKGTEKGRRRYGPGSVWSNSPLRLHKNWLKFQAEACHFSVYTV